MTLQLDERRIAMLEQFGIRWQVPPAGRLEPDPAPSGFAQEDTGSRVEPAMTARATGIDVMQWDELAETVAACRACAT